LNGAFAQHGDYVLTKEGGIHAHFDDDAGERRADFVNTGSDKILCIMGIVDIAGTMEQIEDLSCLSNGAKERVVATPLFMFFIVAYGGVLRMTFGRNDGAVEIQGDACKAAGTQPQDDQFTAKALDVLYAALVGGSQDTADG